MVNVETEELIFSYEEISSEPIESTWEEETENKISILKEQNNQQDETIVLLTYELMMLQEPITTVNLNNNYSANFELINSWFNKGLLE